MSEWPAELLAACKVLLDEIRYRVGDPLTNNDEYDDPLVMMTTFRAIATAVRKADSECD